MSLWHCCPVGLSQACTLGNFRTRLATCAIDSFFLHLHIHKYSISLCPFLFILVFFLVVSRTKHPVGFLSIEVAALRDAMVPSSQMWRRSWVPPGFHRHAQVTHVKVSVKAMQSKLSVGAAEQRHDWQVHHHPADFVKSKSNWWILTMNSLSNNSYLILMWFS